MRKIFIIADVDTNNLTHVVLWSGGIDSTVLLYNLAKNYATKKHPVIAIGVRGISRTDQADMQRRLKIKSVLKSEMNLNIIFRDIKYYSLQSHNWKAEQEPYFGQEPVWFSVISASLRYPNMNYYLGYIKGDDFFTYDVKSPFIKAFKALCQVGLHQPETTRLKFPFEKIDKIPILEEYLKLGLPLDSSIFCSQRSDKACFKCSKCLTSKLLLEKALSKSSIIRENVFVSEFLNGF